jgi:hypothetical protein
MIPLLLLLTLQPRRDFATLNVCQLVPGEAIARALGGKLVEARPVPDQAVPRCRYSVVPAGSDASGARSSGCSSLKTSRT